MNKICTFFGHSYINATFEEMDRCKELIENMILKDNIDTFYFGATKGN